MPSRDTCGMQRQRPDEQSPRRSRTQSRSRVRHHGRGRGTGRRARLAAAATARGGREGHCQHQSKHDHRGEDHRLDERAAAARPARRGNRVSCRLRNHSGSAQRRSSAEDRGIERRPRPSRAGDPRRPNGWIRPAAKRHVPTRIDMGEGRCGEDAARAARSARFHRSTSCMTDLVPAVSRRVVRRQAVLAKRTASAHGAECRRRRSVCTVFWQREKNAHFRVKESGLQNLLFQSGFAVAQPADVGEPGPPQSNGD